MEQRADYGRETGDPLPAGTAFLKRRKTGDGSADGAELAGKPLAGEAEEREEGPFQRDVCVFSRGSGDVKDDRKSARQRRGIYGYRIIFYRKQYSLEILISEHYLIFK